MGPRKAAEIFLGRNQEAAAFEVTLFGSLAATPICRSPHTATHTPSSSCQYAHTTQGYRLACSMASAAASQLFGGSPAQIEYAAEMGLEHHLGMTCDRRCLAPEIKRPGQHALFIKSEFYGRAHGVPYLAQVVPYVGALTLQHILPVALASTLSGEP